jgi:Tfp pilus assembly major pilin PilA
MLRKLICPFPQSPQWLWAVVVVVWAATLLFLLPCNESGSEIIRLLVVVTVWTALWANHWRYQPVKTWKTLATMVVESVVDLLKTIILVVVAYVPIAVFLPAYQCYTGRAKIAEMLIAVRAGVVGEIEQYATTNNTLEAVGDGLQLKALPHGAEGFVTSNGTIVFVSKDPPAAVVMEPQLTGNQISWKCRGVPQRSMPAPCRS